MNIWTVNIISKGLDIDSSWIIHRPFETSENQSETLCAGSEAGLVENGVERDIPHIYNLKEDILHRILDNDELTGFGHCNRDSAVHRDCGR